MDYFRLQVDDIKGLVDKFSGGTAIEMVPELCMVGLAAYFEAFCKNEFAAIINIFPEVLSGFS